MVVLAKWAMLRKTQKGISESGDAEPFTTPSVSAIHFRRHSKAAQEACFALLRLVVF